MLIHTSKSRALQRRHPGHLIEIDYRSTLARGLEVLIDSGSLSDLVHRQKCTTSGVTSALGKLGPSARTGVIDTNSGIFGTVKSTIGSGPMTQFCFVASAYVSGGSIQYACGSYNGAGSGIAIEHTAIGGAWAVFDGGAAQSGAVTLKTGDEYFLVHTRATSLHNIYTNGRLTNSVSTGNNAIPATPFNQNTLDLYGVAWSSPSSIYYSGRYNRTLDHAEVRDLYNYPWGWARKIPHVFAVTSGSSGTTITCSTGDATASGVSSSILSNAVLQTTAGNAVADATAAKVNLSLVTTAANAEADATAAKVNLSLVTTAANAVASGVQASLDGSVTLSTTPANALATGVSSAIAITVVTNSTSASASGTTALVSTTSGVTCTPADAVASGTTVSVNKTVDCTAVSAVADGTTAALVAGGIDTTITTSAGNSVASGVTTAIVVMVTLVTTPANAVATGVTSSVTGPSDVICTPAGAIGSGVQCSISVTVPFEAEIVNLRSALTRTVNLRSAIG